jgi:nicotinamidase-related amidase
MPPSTRRAFGFQTTLEEGKAVASPTRNLDSPTADTQKPASRPDSTTTENGKPKRLYRGLGSDIGPVKLEDGTVVDGGRLLMRSTWNAALPPDLDAVWKHGQSLHPGPADVWIHKNRMSGLWGAATPCTQFLDEKGIRTLFFTGVNTG